MNTRREYFREYYRRNKAKCRGWQQRSRDRRREFVRAQGRGYYLKHRSKRLLRAREWKKHNADRVKTYLREWRAKNKEHLREYERYRRSTNPQAALQHRLSARILKVLSREKLYKNNKTVELVGIGLDGLKKHLESLFLEGMSWENRNLWHIDHKIPCSAFNLSEPEQQKRAFHYTNLQPLWAIDNMRKSNKILP